MVARLARFFLRPSGFVAAGLLLLMPFATVSCEVPGGFGRAMPGGTTVYSGIDLVVGGEPAVDPPDKFRADGPTEKLDPQPLAAMVVLLVIAGIVVATAVEDRFRRRVVACIIAGAAAVFLVTNQLNVDSLLEERVPDDGKDYVNVAQGFWLCLIVLLVTMGANAIGWLRLSTVEAAGAHDGDTQEVEQEETTQKALSGQDGNEPRTLQEEPG